MTKHFLEQRTLEAEWKRIDFALSTQRQLVKDFGMSGMALEEKLLEDPLPYDEIAEIVERHLTQLMQLGERQLLQLLYQIDVPQNDFLALTTESDFLAKLSHLIIGREAYKVYLRQKF